VSISSNFELPIKNLIFIFPNLILNLKPLMLTIAVPYYQLLPVCLCPLLQV